MKTKLIYYDDSYAKEFDATVLSVTDNTFVTLDKTLFYAVGGGQPHDTGKLIRKSDNVEFKVIFARVFNEEHSHQIETPEGITLKKGDQVHGIIDWDRRYKIMRMHTAAHLMCAIIDKESGNDGHHVKFTGSQLGEDKSRFDVNLPDYNPEKMEKYITLANDVIKENKSVSIEVKSREEALKNPDIVKLAKGFDENIKDVRLVSIDGVDLQPCGGMHLKNISEIGTITFLKGDNKGSGNRRIYYEVI